MKLIFHIARKDAVRVRSVWWPWLGVLVAKVAVGFALSGERSHHLKLEHVLVVLAGVDVLMTYLLAAWLVLEDAPMSARQFGLTRPVSRSTLLAAKVVGAGVLLGLAPVGVWLPWWIYSGFGWGDCLREAAVTVGTQGIVILPAFLVASLVDSFRRVLLWTPVVAGLLMIAIPVPLLWIIAQQEGARGPVGNLDQLGLWQSRFLLVCALLVVVAVALVVLQFVRRRPREALALAGVGLGAAATLMFSGPWNFWPSGGEWAEDRPENAAGVEVRLASARLVPHAEEKYGSMLSLRWAANTAAGVEIRPIRSLDRVRWAGAQSGTSFEIYRHYPDEAEEQARIIKRLDLGTMPIRPADPETEAWAETRPRGHLWWSEPSYEPGFGWELSGFSRMLNAHGRDAPFDHLGLRSRMLLAQQEYAVHAQLPLEKAHFRVSGGRDLRVTRVGRTAKGVWVEGIDRRPAAVITRPWFAAFAPAANKRAESDYSSDGLALIDSWNRARPPMMELHWFGSRGFVVGGVALRPFVFQAGPGFVVRDGKPRREPETEEWFKGLRLVAVERRETARIYREVEVEPLVVEPSPAALGP